MRIALPLLLAATLTATGCARMTESRLNPLNWFRSSQAAAPLDQTGALRPLVTADMLGQQVDGRIPVATVDALEVNRTPDGAIIRATGTADRQGVFNAQLVPLAQNASTLVLAFRVEAPQGSATVGPASARQITAARILTNAELAAIRQIRVQAATNARVSSR